VARYRARISGPLLDRIDLHVEVPRVRVDELNAPASDEVETSDLVRARAEAARERQLARAGKPNQALTPSELDRTCPLDEAGRRLMTQALQRLGLSARAYHRVLKVARTIADLAGSAGIETAHLSEAIGYRRLDRTGPGS
jgi:magnesium chelatase family protein